MHSRLYRYEAASPQAICQCLSALGATYSFLLLLSVTGGLIDQVVFCPLKFLDTVPPRQGQEVQVGPL